MDENFQFHKQESPAMVNNPDNKIKLIITDDHRLFRTGVRNGLEKYPDIEIIGEAENGKHLLQLLSAEQPCSAKSQ